MKNLKLICLVAVFFISGFSLIFAAETGKNLKSQSQSKSRTFELIYKAVINGSEIDKGELLSVSEISGNTTQDDILDYINSLLFVENTNQIESVIAINDSISYKPSAEGLINNIYIYFQNKKLMISTNLVYDNMNRLKLCSIMDVE